MPGIRSVVIHDPHRKRVRTLSDVETVELFYLARKLDIDNRIVPTRTGSLTVSSGEFTFTLEHQTKVKRALKSN